MLKRPPVELDEDGMLYCQCGEYYLHQGNTTIFQREEDAPTTTVIAQDDTRVQTSSFPSQDTCNPSPRRHGLIIEFSCENCSSSHPHRLAIYQHKGSTYMEWV